ncbi:DUF885 domain-containing protein [Thermogemmata fonticola]|nr:DUF885 domain-containing protein [Thermogemmata fonticola]
MKPSTLPLSRPLPPATPLPPELEADNVMPLPPGPPCRKAQRDSSSGGASSFRRWPHAYRWLLRAASLGIALALAAGPSAGGLRGDLSMTEPQQTGQQHSGPQQTGQQPAEQQPADQRLAELFQQYVQEQCQRHPYWATQLGNHEHDDRLDDLSPAARQKDVEQWRIWRQRLERDIDPRRLSPSAQIDLAIWKHALDYALWQAEHDDRFRYDPRVYGEYLTDSVFALFTQSTLPRERNVQNAARRITYLPRIIAAAQASLHNPPRVLTEVAIQRTKGAIAFYEKDIYTLAGERPGSEPLATPCRAAVTALQDYLRWLEQELLPRSQGDWRLGPEKFAQKLALELDAGLTAAEVLRLAEAEADRVELEMWYVARQLWSRLFPGKPLPPDDAEGRRFTIRSVLDELAKDHPKAEDLVEEVRRTVENIRRFIRDNRILTLPEPDTCQIVEMPPFQRGYSVAYLNPAPPLDPKAASLYAVAPPPADWPAPRIEAFLREYNRHMLQILTIHEAYPGHYVQLAYANRHPSLIRKVFASGVFAEGWAVYTEQMMLDQGYGQGDLALRLHQLKFYLRAVLNALLDYHMHCSNWDDETARRLLMERGFQTEGEAVGKILRAKQNSVQLSTYFVGRMAFYRLRQQVQRRRGDAFDLGRFHEEVLSHGTLPVKYLPNLVR